MRRALALPLLATLALAPAAFAGQTPSNYVVRPLCLEPAPGHAACLALKLGPKPGSGAPGARALLGRALAVSARRAPTGAPTPAPTGAATPAPAGEATPALTPKPLLPSELRGAYDLPSKAPSAATVAIVDAYDDPSAEADLEVFDKKFGLPACTAADGCFTKLNGQGQSAPLPATNGGWAGEIATDVEVVHSLCPNCRIVLVEANSSSYSALEAAENTAAAKVAAATAPAQPEGVVSNSWGGEEPNVDSSAFKHPGIPITVSSGDDGYLQWDEYETRFQKGSAYFEGPNYPASSPHVVAVGGTSLTVGLSGEWAGEKVWNDSSGAGGGGCSASFTAQSWQASVADWSSVGCGSRRAVADVAADADPFTGVYVYDSTPEGVGSGHEEVGEEAPGWEIIGGTSVASPIVASVFALAGGAHGVAYPAATLYAHAGTATLHDVTAGGNGQCKGVYSGGCSGSMVSPTDCGAAVLICNAGAGYDGPTGLGTPDGIEAFEPSGEQIADEGKEKSGGTEGSGGSESGPRKSGSETPSTGGSNPGGSPGGGGAQPGGTSGGSGSSPAPPGGAAGVTTSPAAKAPRLSEFALSFSAIVALNRAHPRMSAVAFSFTLSAPAEVKVTLSERVRVKGRLQWRTLPGALTRAASAGRNRAHLRSRRALAPGRYRLTLTLASAGGGGGESIPLVIG